MGSSIKVKGQAGVKGQSLEKLCFWLKNVRKICVNFTGQATIVKCSGPGADDLLFRKLEVDTNRNN